MIWILSNQSDYSVCQDDPAGRSNEDRAGVDMLICTPLGTNVNSTLAATSVALYLNCGTDRREAGRFQALPVNTEREPVGHKPEEMDYEPRKVSPCLAKSKVTLSPNALCTYESWLSWTLGTFTKTSSRYVGDGP